ncbi:MAG: response regulator [Deltaproteobacteria bacterium]|nr:response regulator [Deltaproteobacteria bacterium]
MRISLKYKFLVPVLCLIVAGMGTISIVSHIKSRKALTKVLVDEIDNITKTTVSSMSSWIYHRKLDVGNWSKQGIYKKALLNSFLGLTARTFANEQLKRIKQDYGFYDDIVLANTAGAIVADSSSDIIGALNVADRMYFKKAMKGELYVSEHVLKNRAKDNLVFMISAPVEDKGNIAGVLFAVFDVNTFVAQFVDPVRIGKNGYAYIFMEDGLIVSGRDELEISGKDIRDLKCGTEMLQNREGLMDYDMGGRKMVASYKRLNEMNWTIVVCAVKDEIFLPVKNLGHLNAIVSIAVVLVLAMVIFLITHSLSRPIKEVVLGLRQMGKGHLNFRLDIKNNDEIGEIGRELNKMARNLETSEKKIKQQNILLEKARDDLELRVEQRTSELRSAEQKYRGIFENAVEGIFQTTMDGCILNANPSFAGILGYDSVDEMLAGQNQKFFPVSKKDGEKLKFLLETGEKVVAYETRLLRKDGTRCWSSVSVAKIYNEEDRKAYFEGFVIDITEHREMEQAQREWKAAQAANHAKSEFLANMSHEIRTPLNALLGFSELLAVDLTDPKQKSYIDAMKTAGKSLLTLINDILDLSKIEAGKMVFKYEPVNLKILFSEIEYIFKEKIGSKGIKLISEVPDDLPAHLILDETRMRQILLNLVGNAAKFTEKGMVKLAVKNKISQNYETIDLFITIEDTGPGIEKKELKSIFESFKQVNGQINRKYGGTGLGLAICKRLTEAMNGRISVTSEPGVGSTFAVSLKNVKILSDEGIRDVKKKQGGKTGLPCFEKKKILIVDDIQSNLTMLRELLTRFNQDVIEADNGQKALAMAREYHPDIIIMDVRMPVMDGNQATKILKSDPDTKNIPVIAFTGDVVAKTRTGALKMGYDGYLTKPVKILEFTNELSKYINTKIQNEEKEKPERSLDVFLKEDVLNPCELVLTLKNDILPSCCSHENSIVINKIKKFSETLGQLAEKHHVPPLFAFSDDLKRYADLFDITNIERKIKELPLFVEELIKKL